MQHFPYPHKHYLLPILVSILSFSACVKNANNSDTFLQQAHWFFTKNVSQTNAPPNSNNYRARQPRTPQWDQASVVHLPTGDAIVVPVIYRNNLLITSTASPNAIYHLSDLTKLVIQRDSQNHFQINVLTYIPDSTTTTGKPSGLALVEDWQGNSLSKPFQFGSAAKLSSRPTQTDGTKQTTVVRDIQICNEIDGYNYSPDDPDNGTSWSETSCNTSTFPANTTGPSIGPGNIPGILGPKPIPVLTIQLSPPTNPIGNIADYLKCFTPGDNNGHTYTVTLAVEQPVQGTRQPWTFTSGGVPGSSAAGNALNVGHSWLIFSENTGSGVTTRNVGFYPQSAITPLYPSAQGALADDELLDYDIALTVNVNSDQFFNMLTYISQGNNSGYQYNLNSNNCSTFALDALAAGGEAIPSTIGTWLDGQGLDPGDLGEDIRNMSLSGNMTRSTVSNYHPNVGNCN